jgi:hypothetical protein
MHKALRSNSQTFQQFADNIGNQKICNLLDKSSKKGKKQIHKVFGQFPENLLVTILDLLKKVQLKKSSKATWTMNFKRIQKEDNKILFKWAS